MTVIRNVLLANPPQLDYMSVNKFFSTQMPQNLALIAACLIELGANVKIIDFSVEEYSEDLFLKIVEEFKPEIVGFTSMTPSIYYVRDLVKIIKRYNNNILTILGGIHVSVLPKETMEEIPQIDIGVIGEGEETIKEIFNSNNLKSIKGIIYRTKRGIILNDRRPLIKDLNTLPFPARSLLKIEKYNRGHVSRGFSRKHLRIIELITSRGCPNQCIFCAGHVNYGSTVRFRSYDHITSEINLLIQNYDINHIDIEDDTFTLNKDLVRKLCFYLKEKKISWNCNARVDTVDFELLKLMKDCGCKKIAFGVESGSPRILKLIRKNITPEQVKQAVFLAKKVGIKFIECTFMLGSHFDETLDDVKMTKDLIYDLMPDFITVSIITPFPGTKIHEFMKKEGLLLDSIDHDWRHFTLFANKPAFKKLNNFTPEQLLYLQKNILRDYYTSTKYLLKRLFSIRSFSEISYFYSVGSYFLFKYLPMKKEM